MVGSATCAMELIAHLPCSPIPFRVHPNSSAKRAKSATRPPFLPNTTLPAGTPLLVAHVHPSRFFVFQSFLGQGLKVVSIADGVRLEE